MTVPTLVIPITHVIDRETQNVVALATTTEKAEAMIAALRALNGAGEHYYQEDPLPVDQLSF